jgi:4-hydroxy 2-oxovalerate aldolase
VVILDATFRDGGYYTGWNFESDLVRDYLKAMSESKINAVEFGFRSPPGKEIGRFAKVTDFFIESDFEIPEFDYFGVMINSSEYDISSIKKMFCECRESPINLVRSATHFSKIDEAEILLRQLKWSGYTVCLNLMQAADKSYDEIKAAAEKVEKWGTVDVLYLADSLGGMNHDTVNYAFNALREGWSGPVGFHGHNNKSNALDNTLEAVDIGIDWVDSTMLGMGRGPGNTETEYLLYELNKRGFGEFNLEPIYELSLRYFHKLKEQYKWGPSLLYFLTAEYSIHPTYVQFMLSQNYDLVLVLKIINVLKEMESNSFKKELVEEIKNECCVDNSS